MSIPSLTNAQPYAESRRSSARRGETAGLSFQDQLARTGASAAIEGPAIHLRMPNEHTVFSGTRLGQNNIMQEVYAEYTADSTPEDPIVRISGTSDSGPYDVTRHIRDIDPSNASYAELAALYGHLAKTGALGDASGGPLPVGIGLYDVTEKRNYLSELAGLQNDQHYGGVCRAQAAELLALYQPYASEEGAVSRSAAGLDHSGFVKENLLSDLYQAKLAMLDRMKLGKEKEQEEQEWEHMMEYVDAWIESLREEGGSIEKTARAYAAVKSDEAERERPQKRPADVILDALTEQLQQ